MSYYIPQIKAKLGISGILSNSYAWSKKAFIDSDGNEWEGGQIDLIINRNDDIMNFCEMKYSSNELFSIVLNMQRMSGTEWQCSEHRKKQGKI